MTEKIGFTNLKFIKAQGVLISQRIGWSAFLLAAASSSKQWKPKEQVALSANM
jgi:hypothetical protein